MNDVVVIGGDSYISSRRASEISGYAQDHIGYLARRGDITGRQIGGLWYVAESSLQNYRTKIEEYTPQAPSASSRGGEPDSIVTLDGREYVSVKRGADLTGYHQDYVGQLCRHGKIFSKQIGRRWYIERNALLTHRREKNALLAAVQADAVGLRRPLHSHEQVQSLREDSEPRMTYTSSEGDLMPVINPSDGGPNYEYRIADMPISAHIISINRGLAQEPEAAGVQSGAPRGRGSKSNKFTTFAAVIATVVIVVAVGYSSIKNRAIYSRAADNALASVVMSSADAALQLALDLLESVVAAELHYRAAD